MMKVEDLEKTKLVLLEGEIQFGGVVMKSHKQTHTNLLI